MEVEQVDEQKKKRVRLTGNTDYGNEGKDIRRVVFICDGFISEGLWDTEFTSHTIRYYQNEIYASLNQLREQGINAESLSPVEITPNSTLIRDVFGTISLILNWLKTD